MKIPVLKLSDTVYGITCNRCNVFTYSCSIHSGRVYREEMTDDKTKKKSCTGVFLRSLLHLFYWPWVDSNVYVSGDSEAQKTWNIAAFEQKTTGLILR